MDFYQIRERTTKKNGREVYPEFIVGRSKDLMVRGKDFYAVWNERTGMWTQDAYEVVRMINDDLDAYRQKMTTTDYVDIRWADGFSSATWMNFVKYCKNIPDNFHPLDEKLTFADTEVKKSDYVSKRLSYSLQPGPCPAYEELISTLYSPEEREKIEWCIGSILSGDSKKIQKFAVFYGSPGTGKGTVLDIVGKLFQGYCASFSAKDLVSNSNTFALEALRSNPLVAIDADAKLDRIEDNTKMNTVVSHEAMLMNEKFKSSYTSRLSCFLMLGSNHPVKITDAKSGIIRRLIDINPIGVTIPKRHYLELMKQIDFELGQIASHCLQVYEELGANFFDGYIPIAMMYRTDPFFNFVEYNFLEFARNDGISLKNAYTMYKEYCAEGNTKPTEMYRFKEELKNYFKHFEEQTRIDGKQVRSWYSGFREDKFTAKKRPEKKKEENGFPAWLEFKEQHSLLDDILADCPAQYAVDRKDREGVPEKAWTEVKTKLRDIDTGKLHYVLEPPALITIDFDLKNENGEKDLDLNRKAVIFYGFKPTYAELSKSGAGIHLTYYWYGDISKVENNFAPGIEIKVNKGRFSLRRKVSRCNDIPVATISSGIPLKEEKVVCFDAIANELHLRNLIEKALRKEIEPCATKTSIDFIEKILSDAYNQGLDYDVTNLRQKIIGFANHSSHQAPYCLTRVGKMKFCGKKYENAMFDSVSPDSDDILPVFGSADYTDDRLVFFDVEVFPNLFLINWKFAGDGVCQRMINPAKEEIEPLLKLKLVGFNCRRYDNHILYARYIGKTLKELFELSQRIIAGDKDAFFKNAYNLSYTDVYDFASKKQSLKKWEIELGYHHQELGLPWDQPVPEEMWIKVAEYCDNDVFATEAVFNKREADWTARKILADLAGMTLNDTTNSLTTRIIFGDNRNPQSSFNYRKMGDISKIVSADEDDPYTAFDAEGRPIFPYYRYERGKSLYRDEDVGSGGYVYAEPGVHRNVALLDIASMHPSSIVAENLFGDVYTKRFKDILDTRILIKHKQYDEAKKLFDGKLAGYLEDEDQAKDLAGALKIAINSVYGLTSANFENPFRDIRNVDNIVAKRGALFMVNLKHQVQKRGFTVAHIKTDSIKIPNATPEIIQFVTDYGKRYGYSFEHEATYDRLCLVNDAVYIARHMKKEECEKRYGYLPKENDPDGKDYSLWTATGTQFQVPYVFKKLFSHEEIQFGDLCETKSVTSALYLDFNETLPDVSAWEKDYAKLLKQSEPDPKEKERLEELIASGHRYSFVGKVGSFCPVRAGCGGGLLMREKEGNYHAATGTKGYRWKEAEIVQSLHLEDEIDYGYFDRLVDEARKAIEQYEPYEVFTAEEVQVPNDVPPWCNPCGDCRYATCLDCPEWKPVEGACGVDESYQCAKNYVPNV